DENLELMIRSIPFNVNGIVILKKIRGHTFFEINVIMNESAYLRALTVVIIQQATMLICLCCQGSLFRGNTNIGEMKLPETLMAQININYSFIHIVYIDSGGCPSVLLSFRGDENYNERSRKPINTIGLGFS
ncbi:hypothetical protein L9F63_010138, partial [Diploptera punctata]